MLWRCARKTDAKTWLVTYHLCQVGVAGCVWVRLCGTPAALWLVASGTGSACACVLAACLLGKVCFFFVIEEEEGEEKGVVWLRTAIAIGGVAAGCFVMHCYWLQLWQVAYL